MDTDTQILPIHANLVSEEFVGQENRLLLVVRSKREVAQHLEHGLMTGSEPNLGINYKPTLSKSLCLPPARIHNCEVVSFRCSLFRDSTEVYIRNCFA